MCVTTKPSSWLALSPAKDTRRGKEAVVSVSAQAGQGGAAVRGGGGAGGSSVEGGRAKEGGGTL